MIKQFGQLSDVLWVTALFFFLHLISGVTLAQPAVTEVAPAESKTFTLTDIAYNEDTIPIASVAVILPKQSSLLGGAASAFLAGFLAAESRHRSGFAMTRVEVDDTPSSMLDAYLAASARFDIVVGPLSRVGWTAVVKNGVFTKRTIALTQAALAPGDVKPTVLPADVLPIGLSLEAEARQAAMWLGSQVAIKQVLVLTTSTPWQSRVAKAFVEQATVQGRQTTLITVQTQSEVNTKDNADAPDHALNLQALLALKERLKTVDAQAIFVAFDREQTRQLRQVLGTNIPIIGISQLNAGVGLETPYPDLNGVFLIDIPWLFDENHPLVKTIPPYIAPLNQVRDADLDRVYALGIDAFLITREAVMQNDAFSIDGATGKLQGRFGRRSGDGTNARPSSFERTEPMAVYRQGVVVPANASVKGP